MPVIAVTLASAFEQTERQCRLSGSGRFSSRQTVRKLVVEDGLVRCKDRAYAADSGRNL